jgi:hypothetical protein
MIQYKLYYHCTNNSIIYIYINFNQPARLTQKKSMFIVNYVLLYVLIKF